MWYSTIELSTNLLYDGCVRINNCPQMKLQEGIYTCLSLILFTGWGISQHAMGRGMCIPACNRHGVSAQGMVFTKWGVHPPDQSQTLPRPRSRHSPDPEADTPLKPRGRHPQTQNPPHEMTTEVRWILNGSVRG